MLQNLKICTHQSIYYSKDHMKYKVSTTGSFPKVRAMEFNNDTSPPSVTVELTYTFPVHFLYMMLKHNFTLKRILVISLMTTTVTIFLETIQK
jgi:hypothetical protein